MTKKRQVKHAPRSERIRRQVRESVRRIVAQNAEVSIVPAMLDAIDWPRRERTRLDLLAFCREYLPAMFPMPWSADQIESATAIQTAALSGGCFAQAAPRADGKTQRSKAGALWAILHEHARYLAVLAATEKLGKRLMAELAQELGDNEALAQDWPHVCLPIRATFKRANRAAYATINGEPCRLECGASKIVLPTWSEAPDGTCGSVIEGGGILAAMRGLRHATADGRTLRPDLLILDDIQTRKSARSAAQCDERLAVIRGDLKRMAGPDKSLAAVASVTVIRAGDAADQLLDRAKHPEWHGIRKAMIAEWPAEKDGQWKEYIERRREGMRAGDAGAAATAFYAANRDAMDAGAAVSWEHHFVPSAGELSTLQHAFNILADDGEEAFFAECQNAPIETVRSEYEITEPLILSRLSGVPRLAAPAGATFIVAAADVNFCGLNWALGAFRRDASCWVCDWGKEPEGRDIIDRKRARGETDAAAVAGAVVALADRLNRTQVVVDGRAQFVDSLFIDCGYMGDTVLAAIAALRLPLRIFGVRGRGSAVYFEPKDALRRGTRWHFKQWPAGRVLIVDSDYWTEQMQRAFLLPVGVPGAVGLYGTDATPHARLAREIASVRLVEHVTTSKADLYKWHRTPGIPNDLTDAMAYMFAAAAAAGADMIGGAHFQASAPVATSAAVSLGASAHAVRRRQPARVPSVRPE